MSLLSQVCIRNYTRSSPEGDYVPKEYVKSVKACNEDAVENYKAGKVGDTAASFYNPGYAPLSKSDLISVCLFVRTGWARGWNEHASTGV